MGNRSDRRPDRMGYPVAHIRPTRSATCRSSSGVEQLTRNEQVRGSNPLFGSNPQVRRLVTSLLQFTLGQQFVHGRAPGIEQSI